MSLWIKSIPQVFRGRVASEHKVFRGTFFGTLILSSLVNLVKLTAIHKVPNFVPTFTYLNDDMAAVIAALALVD